MISVEVVYAQSEQQILYTLDAPLNTSIKDAIELSGILANFPEIDLNQQKVGIFGQILPLSQPIQAGDRIEIYRPLQKDPKEARLLRTRKVKTLKPNST